MTINYTLTENLELQRNGAMIDLVASENILLEEGYNEVSTGLSMELPKGIMAIVPPRSGLFRATGCIVVNSIGIIDPPIDNNTNIKVPNPEKLKGYVGNGDKWKIALFKLSVIGEISISKGDRLCQFHLQPVMDISTWDYLKWIFKRKIIFNRVDVLSSNKNRGGFNSTGLK